MKRTKILVVNSLYAPYIGGGAEIICQNLAEGLSLRGYEVIVLTLGKESSTSRDLVNGIPVIRMKKCNLYFPKQKDRPNKMKRLLWHSIDIYNLWIKKEIYRVLEDVKPDVALCHNISGFSVSLWDCLHDRGIPIIEVLHDQYLRCPNCNAYKNGKVCNSQCLMCRMMRLPHRRLSNKVDVVVGVSEFVLKSMVNNGYFQDSQKYVIHNAQEIPAPNKKDGWNGERPLKIGYIGSLTETKGVKLLISAFISMSIDAELYIAGSGTKEYEAELRELAGGSKTKFLGYMESSFFYSMIDVCVVPSLSPDTFPGVAYESCAYHVPVIAANTGGIPEVIHHKRNGVLFQSGNIGDLKRAIWYLYENPAKLAEMSERARAEVSEMLDMERWFGRYVDVVQEVKNELP